VGVTVCEDHTDASCPSGRYCCGLEGVVCTGKCDCCAGHVCTKAEDEKLRCTTEEP
jgi:hypothetical protein